MLLEHLGDALVTILHGDLQRRFAQVDVRSSIDKGAPIRRIDRRSDDPILDRGFGDGDCLGRRGK